MDELFKRATITATGFSIAIILLASLMEASGSAGPSNPVWPLVSWLRYIFIWGWVLLLGLFVVGFIFQCVLQLFTPRSDTMLEESYQRQRTQPLRIESTKPKVMSENEHLEQLRIKEEQEIKSRLAEEARKLKEEEQKKRVIEIRKAKSAEDILEEAMDEF